MRLLSYDDQGQVVLGHDSSDDNIPYAILSHTWGADGDEVTYNDLQARSDSEQAVREKPGLVKIQYCADQAKSDGIEHFWVDTCCINKSDLAEVSEAITSMFRWYKDAKYCYVYLADVAFGPDSDSGNYDSDDANPSWKSAFRKSRWFTRGWTLQELIAPEEVVFFSKEWKKLGTKETLRNLIQEITDIPIDAIRGKLDPFSTSERMRWTRGRNTKKREDKAYCLMGLFNVFMPLIYGEGDNAFARLIEQIENPVRAGKEVGDIEHKTQLMYAAINGHEPFVRQLLERNVHTEAHDNQYRTALMFAAMNGHEPVARLLIEKQAGMEAQDNEYRTPLIYAVMNGHEPVARLLLENNASTGAQDNGCRTALMHAVIIGHESLVRLLLAHNASIEAQDNGCRRALMYAAIHGHESLVRLLLERNANVGPQDLAGMTANMHATSNGHQAIASILFEHNANI